ncbi:chaplin [Streptomyces triticiradicis]|uniref:Chaplin n=1 Tax=Streptomyces triticiradicis TaxID=2651189 RepID=A0A7J5DKV7_9ACTN|nr:chaplin [Streptomyces triticiradicis]KAB1989328.1 chaplin [Streptomyces triticiradicis]
MRQVTRKGLITVAAAGGVLAVTGVSAHADSGAIGSTSDSPGVLSGNTVQAPVHVPVNVCGNTVNVVGLLNPAMGNTCVDRGGRGGSSDGRNGHGGHTGREARSGGGSGAGGGAAHSPGVGSGNHVQVPVDVPVNVCGNSVDVVGIGGAAAGDGCATGGSTGGHETRHPGHPGHPGHHGHPDQPGHPGHHGHCEHPGHSGHPDSPGTPGHQGRPGTAVHPGNPGTPARPGTSTPAGGEHRGGAVRVGLPGPGAVVRTPAADSAAQLAHTGSELPLGAVVPTGAAALLAGAVLYRRARSAA